MSAAPAATPRGVLDNVTRVLSPLAGAVAVGIFIASVSPSLKDVELTSRAREAGCSF